MTAFLCVLPGLTGIVLPAGGYGSTGAKAGDRITAHALPEQ